MGLDIGDGIELFKALLDAGFHLVEVVGKLLVLRWEHHPLLVAGISSCSGQLLTELLHVGSKPSHIFSWRRWLRISQRRVLSNSFFGQRLNNCLRSPFG